MPAARHREGDPVSGPFECLQATEVHRHRGVVLANVGAHDVEDARGRALGIEYDVAVLEEVGHPLDVDAEGGGQLAFGCGNANHPQNHDATVRTTLAVKSLIAPAVILPRHDQRRSRARSQA